MKVSPSFYLILSIVLSVALFTSPIAATSYHTITIDGVNDFAADEDVAGTSGSTWYFTWDATNFYFGTDNPDVGTHDGTRWVLIYIDADPHGSNGTSTGRLYTTQQPGLPFDADYHFGWINDGIGTVHAWTWDGSSWVADPWLGSGQYSGTFVEFSIPLSDIGSPAAIKVCAGMINETGGAEWTYYMTPNNNVDGYDADYTHYFGFPLTSGISPDDPTYIDNDTFPGRFRAFLPLVRR